MDYHLFKKPRKIKNKTVHRWYYYYVDPFTGKEIQKACRGCKTQAEAFAYISNLPPLYVARKVTIAEIANFMYIPGSDHVTRLEKLGKELDIKTLKEKRHKLNMFVEEFGHLELKDLTVPMVINYLIPIELFKKLA